MSSSPLTFAFVDLAGYTALTEVHGDEDAANCAARFYALAQRSLCGDTRVVKRIGDAVMLVSSSAPACVDTVLRMFAEAEAEPGFPELRAGLFTGAAVELDGDFFGAAVNLAARIGAHERTGEVLCGAACARGVASDARVRAVPLGDVALKNVAHPVAIVSLLATGAPPSIGIVDPVCRMRVGSARVTIEHEGVSYSFCSDACADRFRASPSAFIAR